MFELGKQIEYLWIRRCNPIDLILSFHPHSLRYLVAYPFLVLSDLFGLPQEFFYTIFIYMCWGATFYLSHLMAREYYASQIEKKIVFWILLILYLPMLYIANGRGIIGMLSVTSLFYIFKNWNKIKKWKRFRMISYSFLLSSVSTGILVCFSFSVILFISLKFFLNTSRKKMLLHLKILKNKKRFYIKTSFLITIFFFLLMLTFQAAMKNYHFYGDFSTMLDHGIPGIFNDQFYRWGSILSLLVLSFFVYRSLYDLYGPSAVLLIVFIFGGLYGRLTFLVAFPALSVGIFSYFGMNLNYKRTDSE